MLTITGGGVQSHHSSIYVLRNSGFPDYTLLITNTPAHFSIAGVHHDVPAHSVGIIDKNTPYTYFNPEGDYSDDWLYFNTVDDHWSNRLRPLLNQFFQIPKGILIQNYVHDLIWERNITDHPLGSENASLLLLVLLNNFFAITKEKQDTKIDNPYFYAFQKIRMDIQNRPEMHYSPEALAEEMAISLSHFQHLYKTFFQQSLKADVIHNRVAKAQRLIATSDLTITEIAEICGYSSDVHFYRQFKRVTGTSPREYQRGVHEDSTTSLEAKKNSSFE
ncbi:AraC family transcriptional regulator [Enterococcus raffinosus]|uniref:helix-turn-helix domain-containing protein n=1 Tax=Enterococcus TaxID=1350 RepID=UPI001C11943E|nr:MULTISPECIES: AraC family transcriptional regulator [Enterococcus]MBU5359576.1 AraC family transcriptional regulator [Enterococcus raffinosus]MDU5336511.1 AraC family transcriptional regulator [Enterococcus sp.]